MANPADYLVVEDPKKPTTWHLQVKKNGKVDHRLLGAAWAALHGGYRGNVYEGPNKAEALSKLKALYKAEGMALPSASKAEQSLGDQMDMVRRAVYDAVKPSYTEDIYPCVEDIYDDYLILRLGDTYYQIDYQQGADGTVTLAKEDAWVVVEEVWQPVKAGRILSSANMQRAQAIHDHAVAMGAQCVAGHDTRPIGAKAGVELEEADSTGPLATMKAVGDRLIEVKVAYYGHKNGRDSHGEYFSPNTDFDTENFPAPPLLYYHGYDASGKKMGRPAVTGTFVSRRNGADGHLLTYKLKSSRYADLQWESAQKNACVVSPGTIGHLIRKAADGELLYWPLAEVSAWDYAPNRAPANLHSVAAPVLKAAYEEAGLTLPSIVETSSPEASGDGASASESDPVVVEQAIAQSVADMLMSLRKGTA